MARPRIKITINSPAVLGFAAVCLAAMGLNLLTNGKSNILLFSVYPASLLSPLTWLRFFTHVLGHADWEHLLSNMMYFLILGPMLEEKYGTSRLITVMLATALVTGVLSFFLFPGVRLLGASGIVFAFILLSSITQGSRGEIPLTFLLVAALYIGRQLYDGIFIKDNVSQLTHIAGGAVGTVLGFCMNARDKKTAR
ncbi:MAG: rhomboid family intramembrane serine protease [Clostridia bacterium]|nr:rhomboid family intramembrane serine protease [Clostridia bacterium]MBR5985260.1 rhomboid family intramembrane serine protease [Clostridia bacterium]MBR6009171.1 rhomboid family intramembrane serine protease [Clostridia bacterium]MBR6499238.1 rhomboid family intramembrane serine protease [Clostridia bacterium]